MLFQVEFIRVLDGVADGTTEGLPHDALEEWSKANNVFQFTRSEDLAYDTNNPRVVYIADTGGTRIGIDPATGRLRGTIFNTAEAVNGRIFRFEFNQDDPARVAHFRCLPTATV